MDSILGKVNEEKEASIQRYIKAKIRESMGEKRRKGSPSSEKSSPIEEIFQKHTRRSLLDFEAYMQQLEKQYQMKLLDITARHKAALSKVDTRFRVESKLMGSSKEGSEAMPTSLLPPQNTLELKRSQSSEQARLKIDKLTSEYEAEVR